MRILAAIFGMAILIFSSFAVAQEGCKYDTQCKGDRICESGVCVSPPATPLSPAQPTPTPTKEVQEPKLPAVVATAKEVMDWIKNNNRFGPDHEIVKDVAKSLKEDLLQFNNLSFTLSVLWDR
ncbi:MAG: hypothetical protein ACRERD_32035 [Candidatus Binatia bacterium]